MQMKVTKKKKAYVSHVYIKITITNLEFFDDDRILKSYKDWVELGFKFCDKRDPHMYHDANQCDCTYYLRLDKRLKYDDIFKNVYDTYVKHHQDYNWFDVSYQINKSVELHKYHIIRFNNLGIMRDMEQVRKYGHGEKNVSMVTMNGKQRPLRHTVEIYDIKNFDDLSDHIRPDL